MSERDDRPADGGAGPFSMPFQHADEADRAEQQQTAVPQDEEAMRSLRFPFEADPADALDQQLAVPVDDDDR